MSAKPLLTFAIPTYNRLDCLRLLIERIADEVARSKGTADEIEILVCDNASTDGAPSYLRALAEQGRIRLLEQASNIGADGNILSCLREAQGRFLWVFGDDDLPLPGVLPRVAAFLRQRQPDLLYLPARWHQGDLGLLPVQAMPPAEPVRLDAMGLALRANAYITFISSWVLNRERYFAIARPEDPARYVGTSLVQLEWHLGLLTAGGALYAARQPWLLARAGNTGGYSLFDTFVARYHRILGEKLRPWPALRDFLQDHLLRGYLPGLVWGMRIGALGTFAPAEWGKLEGLLAQAWPQRPRQRAWIRRIAQWPLPLAKGMLAVCWLDARSWMRNVARRGGGPA